MPGTLRSLQELPQQPRVTRCRFAPAGCDAQHQQGMSVGGERESVIEQSMKGRQCWAGAEEGVLAAAAAAWRMPQRRTVVGLGAVPVKPKEGTQNL